METTAAAGIDAWLHSGGLVVTASERAARALLSDFQYARRSEGLNAWPAPSIQPWNAFVRDAWRHCVTDSRLVLNVAQEEAIWAGIIAAHPQGGSLLEGPRHRMARLAMEAHALLCAYAPQLLESRERAGWQQDSAAFSGWLASFDEACRSGNFVSDARLPLEVIARLESDADEDGRALRAPLLLAGFDRMQPTQRRFLDAWARWSEAEPGVTGCGHADFYQAVDWQSELAACAIWCSQQIQSRSHLRIAVISQGAAARRGEMERAFLGQLGSESLFEFSLGVPIDRVPIAHSAHLLLCWLSGSLAEHKIDWLLASGYAAAPQESSALQYVMRLLRHRGLEQPDWPLEAFGAQCRGVQSRVEPAAAAWLDRMMQARYRLSDFSRRSPAANLEHSPLDWANFASNALESIGWPVRSSLSSAEFQAARRFHQALETAGTLGFDGRRISWRKFLSSLARVLDETLFAPESRGAPIQIVGPAESAGLSADVIWFLGATEDAWPPAASAHPLLPLHVQRKFQMPHATAQLDWGLARAITTRLLASAPEVHFSYARHFDGVECLPSRLVMQNAGTPQLMPDSLAPTPGALAAIIDFEDRSAVPFLHGEVEGGAAVLTFQSQCPFKAFATVRLGAQGWQPAQLSLTPAQRGKLLHAVLHAIWGLPPPDGLRNLNDLLNVADRPSFVSGHVRRVFQQDIRNELRQRMPRAYLELEEERMVRLIGEWLDYESARANFEVVKTEDQRTVHLAGLSFNLRLDRIDRLQDRTLLVMDYKTGDISPKVWDLPRPDDLQLPLYAGFALDPDAEVVSGLAFARVRPAKIGFAGLVGDAQAMLLPSLSAQHRLVREPFAAEMLIDWRDRIETLAKDFLAGRGEADPRDYPKTCSACRLHTLCRIHENSADSGADEDGAGVERMEGDE
jgi:ATP-dependent helicase/nuclease subunit B